MQIMQLQDTISRLRKERRYDAAPAPVPAHQLRAHTPTRPSAMLEELAKYNDTDFESSDASVATHSSAESDVPQSPVGWRCCCPLALCTLIPRCRQTRPPPITGRVLHYFI